MRFPFRILPVTLCASIAVNVALVVVGVATLGSSNPATCENNLKSESPVSYGSFVRSLVSRAGRSYEPQFQPSGSGAELASVIELAVDIEGKQTWFVLEFEGTKGNTVGECPFDAISKVVVRPKNASDAGYRAQLTVLAQVVDQLVSNQEFHRFSVGVFETHLDGWVEVLENGADEFSAVSTDHSNSVNWIYRPIQVNEGLAFEIEAHPHSF